MPLKIAVYASCNYVLASLRRSAVVTLACISGFLICTARVNAGDQEVLLTGYSVRTWNEGDGRPLGGVSAIVQHPRGYLWIGATQVSVDLTALVSPPRTISTSATS